VHICRTERLPRAHQNADNRNPGIGDAMPAGAQTFEELFGGAHAKINQCD
jgi:hypothetical protein